MADYERTVLEHYQLSTAYPTEWPAEKDLSDASDEEGSKPARNGFIRRSKSRYSVLERSASDRRSLVPGSQKTGDGLENLVQKDESDPLGTADSVVRILRSQGLPVQDDIALREFLVAYVRACLTITRQ
jgi:exocyst complex component 2